MASLESFSVDHEEQLANIPRYVEHLILGQQHRRAAAHTGRQSTFILDGEQLAVIIMSLTRLVRVDARAVRWLVNVPPPPPPAPMNVVYLLEQAWPASELQDDAPVEDHRYLALPVNIHLSDSPSTPPPNNAATQIRVVRVMQIPMAHNGPQWLQVQCNPRRCRELILDVASTSSVLETGCVLSTIGRHIQSLVIRWNVPVGLEHVDPYRLVCHLRFPFCPSLLSLSLTLSFVATRPEIASTQFVLNVGLLNSSTAMALRLFHLCVIVPADDVVAQVKQTHWRLLLDALARFPNLRGVDIVVKGADEVLSDEVWQEIEFPLRPLRARHVLLMRSQSTSTLL